jgi:hypothetical protein
MEVIRFFVASDPRMGAAERALAHSIAKNTSGPYEITFMRAGDPGWDGGPGYGSTWNIGREPGVPYSRQGWATDFTGFRWAIPELCGFEGRAIYQDVDQLDLGDMRELWEAPLAGAVKSVGQKTCVMLLDCARFAQVKGWPALAAIRGGVSMYHLRALLGKCREIDGSLPREWNMPDKWTPDTRVLHFTNMRTQPWKPWPEFFDYPAHRDERATRAFWTLHDEAPDDPTLRRN